MTTKYEIDNLDRQILTILLQEARTPFIEIARTLSVSGGTVHQRVDRMKASGLVKGTSLNLDLSVLGFDVTVFLGIHLVSSKATNRVIQKLEKLKEVVEAYYTTGNYALLVKVHTRNIKDFHEFLTNKLQAIDEIQATESFISLSQPIARSINAKEL